MLRALGKNSRTYPQLPVVNAGIVRGITLAMQKQSQAATKVDCMKKEQYQTKLGLWELKNEVIDLQAILQEEENQYNRLYQEVGFEQGQAQEPEEPQVGLEGGEEGGMEEGSRPLSVSQGQLDEVAPIEPPS